MILDDDVRWILTKGKLPTRTGVEVVTTAHRVGLRSSSMMICRHVDNRRHLGDALRVLCRIQDQTVRFIEFVPLPFVRTVAPIYRAGVPRRWPSILKPRGRRHDSDLLLGAIDNVQTSWVKLRVGAPARCSRGPNDLSGTLMLGGMLGGDHLPMAGSDDGSGETVADLAGRFGRPVRERATTYGVRIRTSSRAAA